MSKRTSLRLLLVLLFCSAVPAHARAPLPPGLLYQPSFLSPAANDREQDGLAGPVRRVKTETAKITVKSGQPVEGPRVPLEVTTYDQKGSRVDNAYFLAAGGSLTGKEVYKYDDKGNMVEMTLYKEDGTLLSKEVYSYTFDAVGNWVKMTTSVAVVEGGQVAFEPTEVTYRTISYFLEESTVAKMAQPSGAGAKPNATPQQAGAVAPPKTVEKNASPASQPSPGKSAARNVATPVVLASLDKTSVVNPTMTATDGAGVAAGGPVVKSDGDAPAQPSARGPLKPVSGGILNGKAQSLPAPVYPDAARRTRTVGTVEVEVVIDLSGKVISAKAVKGPMLLQSAAEQAARHARFSPTLLSGQPVKVSGVINYNFSLQ